MISSAESILILGSKPNAKIIPYNFAYCANSASSYYEDELFKHGNIKNVINFVSASEVMPNTRINAEEKTKWLDDKFLRIIKSPFKKIILHTYDIFPESIDLIKSSGFDGKLSLISLADQKNLLKNLNNLYLPIFTKYHIEGLSETTLKHIYRYTIEYFKVFKNTNYLCSALFRPSTGVLSLIYAIGKHGKSANYTLAGIGFGERGSYPDNIKNTWTPQANLSRYHIYVDRHVVYRLSKIYNIEVFDEFYKNNINVI